MYLGINGKKLIRKVKLDPSFKPAFFFIKSYGKFRNLHREITGIFFNMVTNEDVGNFLILDEVYNNKYYCEVSFICEKTCGHVCMCVCGGGGSK